MKKITFDFFSIITSIGIFMSFFFSIVIITKKTANRKANILLALLLTAVCLSISYSGLFFYTNLYYYIPHVAYTSFIWVFLFGPLFLFYVWHLTIPSIRLLKRQYLNFLPSMIYIVFRLPFFLKSAEYKIEHINKWLNGTIELNEKIIQYTILVLAIAHVIIYLFLVLRYLKKYQQRIKEYFSSIEKIDLSWIWNFIIFFFIIFISIAISTAIIILFNIDYNIFFRLLPVLISLFVCVLAYKGLMQADVFSKVNIKQMTLEYENKSKKYRNINLPHGSSYEYYSRLLILMREKKVYKNPELSIQDLAKALKIPSSYVSYILNEYANLSFYNFINSYRVKEVKKIISQAPNKSLNILDVAFEAGFNSKTTFNKWFKKTTKKTPSEFMRHL